MSGAHKISLSSNVILAPMAGIAEAPFRAICKRMGAGLTYTEMVSTTGLRFNPGSPISKAILTLSPDETPCAVQILGSNPTVMAEETRGILERLGSDVAMIDINMGCPVSKVVTKGRGCTLMRTPDLAAQIVREVAGAIDVPVGVKFRKGWTAEEVNAVEFARMMEEAGAANLAVHGRTCDQLYEGEADWEIIAAVKQAVSVPVFGSGDVFSAQDVKAMLEQTGVDAVMVARGAQGNPWIFREARALLDTGESLPPPTATERIEMAREHLAAIVEFGGERAFVRMRKHVGWYTANLPGATRFRSQADKMSDSQGLDALLTEYRDYLEERETRLATHRERRSPQ